ncbi:MAG: hypothetical protein Q8Q42_03555 [Nanoarchaeota archaeon]|nr:hypothetical protein [Nanoarchaeota archaeon]
MQREVICMRRRYFAELEETEAFDDGVYSEQEVDYLLEDDEISPEEAAFMEGYHGRYKE